MNQRIESPQARAWVNQPFSDPDTRQFVQDVLVRMDELVNRFQRTPSDQYNTEEWEIPFTGSETAGQYVRQRQNIGFKARSCIAFNTSGHELAIGGGMVIPAATANFVFRVTPPTDMFAVKVFAAGTSAGEAHLYFTEELLTPSSGTAIGAPSPTGSAATGLMPVVPEVYNGSTYDAAANPGVLDGTSAFSGMQSAGVMGIDPASGHVQLVRMAGGDGLLPKWAFAIAPVLFSTASAGLDRSRANDALTLLAAAARTATTSSPDQTNFNWRGLQVVLNVTAASGTGGLIVTVQGKDPVSGNYYNLNANPAGVTATGTYVYEVYPGVGAAGGGVTQRISGILPRTFRVTVTAGDGSSYTYSVAVAPVV